MKQAKHLLAAWLLAIAAPLQAAVVINEIMYHPSSDNPADEFVEIYNTDATPVALDGWCFDGIDLCFGPSDTIGATSYLILAADPAQFALTYGEPADHGYLLQLDNEGERLALKDDTSAVVDEVDYGDEPPWPVTPDGLGPSLEVIDASEDNQTPRNWRASSGGPTPGDPNSAAAVGLPPWIQSVTTTPDPAPGSPIDVAAEVLAASTVELFYRIDFDSAEQSLTMEDNGVFPDSASGDGIYSVSIPAQPAGTMVRFRIETTGPTGAMDYPREDDSVTYDGTVVVDPVASGLPVLHWFIHPDDYTDATCNSGGSCHLFTDDTEPAFLYYDGRFYDGVQVRVRGQSSRSWPKKHWKVRLPQGHEFKAPGLLGNDVDQFNLQSGYVDKTLVRELLSWETFRDAGAPANRAFHLRVEQNGQFYGLYLFLEDSDADWVRRNDLNPAASRYKAFSDCRELTAPELEEFYEPQGDEDHQDLPPFLGGINDPVGQTRRDYILDNVDIPTTLNYMAAQILLHNNDHVTKNYFLYRDAGRTERWTMHGWDLDLTFGKNFDGNGVFDDVIWADLDQVPGEPSYISPSHPLFGDTNHRKIDDFYNRFVQSLLREDDWRAMYYRRLRTLMDELLAEGRYESRIAELELLIGPEAALDKARPWGEPGTPQDLTTAIGVLQSEYLDLRRVHLFQTHSVCTTDIPPAQSPAPRVVISEIMYQPLGGSSDEFVELYNPSATEAVDLSGWRLDGVALELPPGTVILPESYLLVVKNDAQFRTTYGGGRFIAADYAGGLKNSGESVVLRNPNGAVVSGVTYEAVSPWPQEAAGQGYSLELIDPAEQTSRVANWAASSNLGGTPGVPNSSLGQISPVPDLFINEVLPDNVSVNQDNVGEFSPWIEIYNASAQTIDLVGMHLSDDPGDPTQWLVPESTPVCGGCWALIWVDGQPEQGQVPLHADFALDPAGGFIGLFDSGGALIDYLNYPALPADHAYGRLPDGSAEQRILSVVTPEALNDAPTSPLVLNEYNAVSSGKLLANGNSDSFWGEVEGNGGDWFELVVTTDHLDVRGWQLYITDNTGGGQNETTQTLTFTQHDDLRDLRAGTILTVSEERIDDMTFDPQSGDWWINVQAADGASGTYVTAQDFTVSNELWQLTIRDDVSVDLFGPAGEGIRPLSGVGNQEVFKLEEDPGPFLTPLADYNAGTSSTFGSPNVFNAGNEAQDFSALREIGQQGTCTLPDGDGDGVCDAEDNCPGISNTTQDDGDGDGIGDVCDVCPDDAYNDADLDGYCAGNGFAAPKLGDLDNCPFVSNPTQDDEDSDEIGDVCDNCTSVSNVNQEDEDGDNIGDACELCPGDPINDPDGDGVCHSTDKCPDDADPLQLDGDGDGVGDVCDLCPSDPFDDVDLDGFCVGAGFLPPKVGDQDNCAVWPNPGQVDGEGDGVGDLCDNCPATGNSGQEDLDGDGLGNACDPDRDGDGVANGTDLCPDDFDPGQLDTDGDGAGDACDGDDDDDGDPDSTDNCSLDVNPLQEDADGDGYGDICDCDAANSSLGQVPPQIGWTVRLEATAGATLRWDRAFQGHISNVYRGAFTRGSSFLLNHVCFDSNRAEKQVVDGETPASGVGFYYLVSGANECGEGAAGDGILGYVIPVDPAGTYIEAENFTGTLPQGTHTFAVEATTAGFSGVGYLRPSGGEAASTPAHEGKEYLLDFPAPGTYNVWMRGYAVSGSTDSAFVGLDGAMVGALNEGGVYDSWVWTSSIQLGANQIVVPSAGVHTLNLWIREPEHLVDGLYITTGGETPAGLLPDTGSCPAPEGPEDRETDTDGVNDKRDNCPLDIDAGQLDDDLDFVGNVCDICPADFDPEQIDTDGTGGGDACDDDDDDDGVPDGSDNCRVVVNPLQEDTDLDTVGDACDPCTDTDGDGLGDPGFPANRCKTDLFPADVENDGDGDGVSGVVDNCRETANADQDDGDGDGAGDACDPCPGDPDDDIDGDGLCAGQCGAVEFNVPLASGRESVLLEYGTSMDYLVNQTDPGIALEWVLQGYDTTGWSVGTYGVGYEAASGAEALIQTAVPVGTFSVYTRATFQIAELDDVQDLFLGADYDDGVVVWLNGVRIYTSPEMPVGGPQWDSDPSVRESSNGSEPDYGAPIDVSTAIPLLVESPAANVLAVGVWNHQPFTPPSDDLVLVPRLSINRAARMSYLPNATPPPISGIDWVDPPFDDTTWSAGSYGVGYDTNNLGANALALIDTTVDPGTRSIYTRGTFDIDDVNLIEEVMLGVDYDDGYVLWINGTEVSRSSSMPPGDPEWDASPSGHESSNATAPQLDPPLSVTSYALPVLQTGTNDFAIGVWNTSGASSDLVLYPSLSVTAHGVDNCALVHNPTQLDVDGDGVGDACDNCVNVFNAQQTDSDGNGVGDACE